MKLKIVLDNERQKEYNINMRTWTDEEIKYLRENYNKVPMSIVAGQLGRSAQSIRSKIHNMRKKGMTFHRRTDAKR